MKIVNEPEHKPAGDPCDRCGLAASRHRHRVRKGRVRTLEGKKRRRASDRLRYELSREKRSSDPIVAIDGEGKGRNPHVYTYLAASDEHGEKRGCVAAAEGLSTLQCLEFLLGLGVPRVFGFSLGYDFSMMLRDLPDDVLYLLVRPEKRARMTDTGRVVHRPVYWRGFKLSYMRRRLGIQRVDWDPKTKKSRGVGPSVIVWDVFAFYQGKFTKALGDWKTTGEEEIAEIARMKNQRSEFDRMSDREIWAYCDKECWLLARLVRQLIEAHETAGLPLRDFYGAGSTASALLSRMGVRDYKADPPAEMTSAVARGFFGGRFELSRCGPVEGACWNHDISSAYPYQLWRLPCLTCGRWKLRTGTVGEVDRAVRGARLALVHCRVRGSGPKSWGPLPFRMPDGTILFPLKSEGSWVWQDEYLAARDTLWPGVEGLHAWCYETSCSCRPFAELPEIYRERLRIGKDGAGIVLKLGPNSCYGKCAQSVGAAPFRSWVWAGAVTSGTRAQLLRAIAAAGDPGKILMVATDGVLARERLSLGEPEDTGTGEGGEGEGKGKGKPLGGWEVKEAPRGVFLARPGIYWPLKATEEELREIRARGISRSVLVEQAGWIERWFRKHGWKKPYQVDGRCLHCQWRARPWRAKCPKCAEKVPPPCVRFVGVRQGIGVGRGAEIVRRDNFGEWVEWPIDISFAPMPKRVTVRKDLSLETWERMPGVSSEYSKARCGAEGVRIREYTEMLEEQPDGDLTLR